MFQDADGSHRTNMQNITKVSAVHCQTPDGSFFFFFFSYLKNVHLNGLIVPFCDVAVSIKTSTQNISYFYIRVNSLSNIRKRS